MSLKEHPDDWIWNKIKYLQIFFVSSTDKNLNFTFLKTTDVFKFVGVIYHINISTVRVILCSHSRYTGWILVIWSSVSGLSTLTDDISTHTTTTSIYSPLSLEPVCKVFTFYHSECRILTDFLLFSSRLRYALKQIWRFSVPHSDNMLDGAPEVSMKQPFHTRSRAVVSVWGERGIKCIFKSLKFYI